MKHPYLVLAAIVLAVCGQIIFFKFTYLDDYTLIVQNGAVLGNASNLSKAFSEDFMKVVSGGYYYRPLATLSFMLNSVTTGQNPLFFRAADVLLHLLTVIVLYKLLISLTGKQAPAFLGALFFAIHPVVLQTIAWIPARNDTMAALFTLIAVYAFHKAWKTENIGWYFAHFTAMTLALLSKELGTVIPVICSALLFLVIRRFDKKKIAVFLAGWAALVVCWYFLRASFINESGQSLAEMLYSALSSFHAMMVYFGKIILPFNLSTHPVFADINIGYPMAAAAVFVLSFVFWGKKEWRLMAFGIFWFVVFLIPSLIRPNPGIDPELLEHRVYLPMIGIVIVLAELAIPRYLAIGAISIFALVNLTHARSYKDGLSYWSQAASSAPHSATAHRQLGVMQYLAGDTESAENEYQKAIALDFQQPIVHTNLGLLYQQQGKLKAAEVEFLSEIAVNPKYDQSYFNLGNLYYQQGELVKARLHWLKALEINPHNSAAQYNLNLTKRN